MFRLRIFSLLIFIFLIFPGADILAQTADAGENFYFDAVIFKSDSIGKGRVDVYAMVPYQTLQFVKTGELYGAKYNLHISVTDSIGREVKKETLSGKIAVKDYLKAQGGTAGFKAHEVRFVLPPGNYSVQALLVDKLGNKEYRRARDINILNFDKYPFVLSGILLLSSIEQRGDKFIITPHPSDNIGALREGFFAFFEVYNSGGLDSADFIYGIYEDKDGEPIISGQRTRMALDSGTSRHFLRIERPEDLATGQYFLRISAISPSAGEEITNSDYLAIAQRSIKLQRTISGKILDDIDLAIEQLRYAAHSDEIDYIKEGETKDEKINRFEDFWKKRDPTPNTERNEAFREYFARIEYTNDNFGSYTQGWRSDRGMVFIIFGPPSNVERYSDYGGRRMYEKWIYRNNREFIFVDNSGFGDFRLARPLTVSEKYKYRD